MHKDRLASESQVTAVIKADMLDNPREKALMLHYVEWWTRLAELAQNNKDQNI